MDGKLGPQDLHDHAMAQLLVTTDVDNARAAIAQSIHDPVIPKQRTAHVDITVCCERVDCQLDVRDARRRDARRAAKRCMRGRARIEANTPAA
ncbi:MAG: hypothetical protein E6J91_02315 [Deltaproteobacteria bacterium]|nr:MAG: hypothetical protein E6J91_02315 [Deltaproteobacteria bacterium]